MRPLPSPRSLRDDPLGRRPRQARPPSLWRLVLFLVLVIAAISMLLRHTARP